MASALDPVHVLRGHFGEVQSLSFLSEDRLYTGDSNGEVRLWDLSTCRPEFSARLHDTHAGLLHLACMPQCGALISQGRDGCVRVWAMGHAGALDRSQPVSEIRTESFNFCRCAVWAPGHGGAEGGRTAPATGEVRLQDLRVACADHDPADVGVWRPGEAPHAVVHLRQRGSEAKHGMCMSLAFVPAPCGPAPQPAGSPRRGAAAGVAAATGMAPAQHACEQEEAEADAGGSRDHGADLQACTASGMPRASEGVDDSAGGLAESHPVAAGVSDPRFIVTGYEDGVVALWDLRSPGTPLGSLRVHSEPVMCLAVHARTPPARGGRRRRDASAAGGEAGGAAQDATAAAAGPGPAPSYDMVSGSADDQVSCCVLRPAEAQPVSMAAQPLRLREAGTADVAIRSDGKLFACGCWDGRARLYSLRRREPLAVLKYHLGQVTAVAFSPETNTLATASRDTTVALWSVYPTAGQPQQ